MWTPEVNVWYLCSTSLILFLNIIYTLWVWLFWLHVCFWIMCIPSDHWGQRRALDALEMELQTVVSPHISAGNWTRTLCKSSKCSWQLSHLSIPAPLFYKTMWSSRVGQAGWAVILRNPPGSTHSPSHSQLHLVSTLPWASCQDVPVHHLRLTKACLRAYLRNAMIKLVENM